MIHKKFFYYCSLLLTASFPWIHSLFDEQPISDIVSTLSLSILATCLVGIIITAFETRKMLFSYKFGAFLALFTLIFVNWLIPAVGIVGIEGNPLDVGYFAMIVFALPMALKHSFDPNGLMKAMLIAAIVPIIMAIFTLTNYIDYSLEHYDERVAQAILLNGCITTLCVGAALFFWEANQNIMGNRPEPVYYFTQIVQLKKLEHNLTQDRLSELESMLFLFANWAVFGFISYAFVGQQYDNPGVIILLTALPLIGLFLGYRANASGDNLHFLKRFIPIHFVLGIRFMFICMLTMVLTSAIAKNYLASEVVKGFFIGGSFLFIIGLFYYQLAKSIQRIARK